MGKTYFCHQYNPPGIKCSMESNGVCLKMGGIFKCENAKEYPKTTPINIPSVGSKAALPKDRCYDDGYKDGYATGVHDVYCIIDRILTSPSVKPTKEEAIKTLKKCGIIDDNGEIVDDFKEILTKKEV